MSAFVWVAFTACASAILYVAWEIYLSVRHLRRDKVQARRRREPQWGLDVIEEIPPPRPAPPGIPPDFED